ncbi:MAG: hypothetical protein GXO69_06300 [Acidobacteria bacterium]|nr:hypothetical protein [Acidobacteriota bacterium]
MRKFLPGILLFIVSVQLIAAQPIQISEYQDPGKIFTITVPTDWHTLYIPFSGQRVFVFSVEKMSPEKMATRYNPKAMVLIKMVRMSSADSKLSLKDLAVRYFNYLQKMHKQKGMPYNYKITGNVKINGSLYIKTKITAGNTSMISFIGTHKGTFVELSGQADEKNKKEFLPLLQKIIHSFQYSNLPAPGPWKRVSCASGQIQLKVPSTWFVRREHSKDADQTFISREKIQKAKDIFRVGITINLFSDLRKFWKIGNHATEASLLYNWYQAMNSSMKKRNGQIYTISSRKISGLKAIYWERSYQADDKSYIQEYHLSIIRGFSIYDFIFEAPVMEFERYRPVFDDVINSIQVIPNK